MRQDHWDKVLENMVAAAASLKKGGADFILLGTNTVHIIAEDLKKAAEIELLHIGEATGKKIKEMGISRVGLLGTRFTMEKDFYKKKFKEQYGIETVILNKEAREKIHAIIFEELCLGVLKNEIKQILLENISDLTEQAVEGIILGCTELPLLIKQAECSISLFNTTELHAKAAVAYALSDN